MSYLRRTFLLRSVHFSDFGFVYLLFIQIAISVDVTLKISSLLKIRETAN